MKIYLSGTINGEFRNWPLTDSPVAIGRSSKNAVQLIDATVSKDHAEIFKEDGLWHLRDLKSRNGTRVNGLQIDGSVELKPGDRLEIGHVPLQVTDGEPVPETVLSNSVSLSSSLRIPVNQILKSSTEPRVQTGNVMSILTEAGQLLILPRPLRETCEEILKIVERAVPATRLMLLLKPSPKSELKQMAGRFKGGTATQPLALSNTILNTVLEENTSVLTTDATADPRFQGQQSIVAQAVHSAIAVPLFDNESVLGILYADSNDFRTRYTQDNLEVMTLLANMAAVKITNARLLETEQARLRMAQELNTATAIQRSLLPPAPVIDGYSLKVFLETCHEVGGDLYDFHQRSDGIVYFLLGDVSGKGMGAAMLMSSVMTTARAMYDDRGDPVDIVRRLNAIIHRSTDPGHFLTAFLGALNPATGEIRYVNAGHNPPYLLVGSELTEIEATGVPIGMLPDFPYTEGSFTMPAGSLFTLFTDGVPEACRNEKEFFDEERLMGILKKLGGTLSVEDMSAAIITSVDEFLAGEHRGDDLTLMLIRRG